MNESDANRKDTIILRVNTEDLDWTRLDPNALQEDVSGRVDGLESEVKHLRKSNDEMLRMMRESEGVGELLKQFLASQNSDTNTNNNI
jgi:hypothetical protein